MKRFLTCLLVLLAITPSALSQQPVEDDCLDYAPHSVDDSYTGCEAEMMRRVTQGLLAKEMASDGSFSDAWRVADYCIKNSSFFPPTSRLNTLHKTALALSAAYNGTFLDFFDDSTHYLGPSEHVYREYYPYKSLHFLLTDAVRVLKEEQRGRKEHCQLVYASLSVQCSTTQVGDQVRVGSFLLASSNDDDSKNLILRTCHGVKLPFPRSRYYEYHCFSGYDVLIPPYEMFNVVAVKRRRDKYGNRKWKFILESVGQSSHLQCNIKEGSP